MNRIAFVLNDLSSYSEVFIHEIIDGLNKTNEVEVYYFHNNGNYKHHFLENIKKKKISTYKEFSFIAFVLLNPLLVYKLRFKLKRLYRLFILRKIKTEKVYFPFISMLRDFHEILHLANKEIYTSIRGTDITITPILNPNIIDIYKKIYEHIKGIHYLSEELKEESNKYGLNHFNEHIIYQSIDEKLFSFNENIPNDKLRLITIGRLHWVKGTEYSIKIAKKLKDLKVDFELLIIGNGNDYEALKYLIHKYNLDEEVKLLGSKSKIDIINLLKRSNVYLHTHKVNGLSNTMLEALYSGLSVVTFNSNISKYSIAGLTDLIIEAPKFSIEAFTEKLMKIERNQMYGNNEEKIEIIKYHFNLNENINKYSNLFNL